jgi:activator of 2-hydroxyglutaryl-CoA dehydratase
LLAGMARALEEVLACPVRVAPHPQYTGALGAALSARATPRPTAGL